jgi:hypothetical protein
VSLENNQQVKSDENQEHSAKVDNSRRSFARKSVVVAPMMMTLVNRSALASVGRQVDRCTHSGFASLAVGSVSPVNNLRTFDPPPPDENEDPAPGLTEYQAWAAFHKFPVNVPPMSNWLVPEWKIFIGQCHTP